MTRGSLSEAFSLAEEWYGPAPGPPAPLGVGVAAAGLLLGHSDRQDAAAAAVLVPLTGSLSATQRQAVGHRLGPRITHLVASLCESPAPATASWSDRKQSWLEHLAAGTATALLAAGALRTTWATAVLELVATTGPEVLEHLDGGRQGALWLNRAILATVRPALPSSLIRRLESLCEVTEGVVAASLQTN